MAKLLKELTVENGRGETILWGRGIAVKITRTYKRLKEYRIGATVPVKQRVWLDPDVVDNLIREEVGKLRDDESFEARQEQEGIEKALLQKNAMHWPKVAKYLDKL